MKSHLKIQRGLVEAVRDDLRRPHRFAHERVGFLKCRFALTAGGLLLTLAKGYHPVADEDYIDEPDYGAVIGSNAFRRIMQIALTEPVGLFHVHLHDHYGRPTPSPIDLAETKRFVPDFFHIRPRLPHGAIVLSTDSVSGRIWNPTNQKPICIDQISIVGAPLSKTRGN